MNKREYGSDVETVSLVERPAQGLALSLAHHTGIEVLDAVLGRRCGVISAKRNMQAKRRGSSWHGIQTFGARGSRLHAIKYFHKDIVDKKVSERNVKLSSKIRLPIRNRSAWVTELRKK